MTKLFSLSAIVVFLTASSLRAEDFPDCWMTDDVVPGRYLIGGDLQPLSKEEVIGLIDVLQGKMFQPVSYFTLFSSTDTTDFFIPVEHRSKDAGGDRELQLKMIAEIQGILSKYKGLYAECDPIVMPKKR